MSAGPKLAAKLQGATGPALASAEVDLADRAVQEDGAEHFFLHENALDSLVEAGLTNVVLRLRQSWIAGPAGLWGDIHPIHEDARGEFEQGVATALRERFFQFSQFLAGLEVVLLERQQLRVVAKQPLLGAERALALHEALIG